MTITLLRQNKLSVVTRVNECKWPSFEVAIGNWGYNWFGTGGNGTNDVESGGASWNPYGDKLLRKIWTTSPQFNNQAGFVYGSFRWTAGVTKTISGTVLFPAAPQLAAIHIDFFDVYGRVCGSADTGPQQLQQNQSRRLSLTATAPDGTYDSRIYFWMPGGDAPMPVGGKMLLDGVLFETTRQLLPYFDGSMGAGQVAGDSVSWAGTAHQDISYYWQPDPNTKISPDLVIGYDDEQVGSATPHTLLSGAVTATWQWMGPGGITPGSTRTGTLRLLFGGDTGAARSASARAGFMMNDPWHYADTDNPEADMNFVPSGPIRRYQSDSRATWLLDVPFTELSAPPWKAPVG